MASKHGVHKRSPICFRPEEPDHEWLLAYSEATGIPVNRIMADALTVFRSQLAIHSAEHDQEPDAHSDDARINC